MRTKQDRVNALMNRGLTWPIHDEGVRLIAFQEDCVLTPYRDIAGVWTCGWGETDGVIPGKVWTQQYADHRFQESLEDFTNRISKVITEYATLNQLAAMVSLSYNIGVAGFSKSTVLRRHNAGDRLGAARAFGLWNKAKVRGKLTVISGLTSRRAAEASLYLQEEDQSGFITSVQAVAPESSLAFSPIMASGAVTTSVGTMAFAGQAGSNIELISSITQRVKELTDNVAGIPQGWIIPLVVIVAGAVAMYWRYIQRKQGWT